MGIEVEIADPSMVPDHHRGKPGNVGVNETPGKPPLEVGVDDEQIDPTADPLHGLQDPKDIPVGPTPLIGQGERAGEKEEPGLLGNRCHGHFFERHCGFDDTSNASVIEDSLSARRMAWKPAESGGGETEREKC